jgi:hypothetical protein
MERQPLDWRRVAIFTPLMASIAIFLVYARDLRHKQDVVIAVLLFALYTTLFQVLPMRELHLPRATRKHALLISLAGLVVYAIFARTQFFQQTPLLSLVLLIFIVIEVVMILIVRGAANIAKN